ncbi:unnamed protein product [Mytilus coruscus]|uniref:Reverse transcriptase domain-containing protein n=1 Tax=Mytilus coruscus TaxID=42192 RepID=A0A6J8ED57_MYTCO|nr:unnamed protein product [Mytilus coruscus]
MLRRTARKRKAKGQDITLPRNTTTRAEILTTGHQTQTSMPMAPTFSTARSRTGPITYSTDLGSVISPHSGAIYATASPQSSTSAYTNTVSSHTQHTDNNVPVQHACNQFINLTPTCTPNTSIQQMYIPQQIYGYIIDTKHAIRFKHSKISGTKWAACLAVCSKPVKNLWYRAEQNSDEVLHKLQDEVNRGRMLGPFKVKPISTLRINPIGLVPKSDSSWRLITNLSFPPGESVNSYIDQKKIYQCGLSSELARIDVKSAFRNLIVNPADFDLLGIKFNDHFYIDKSLPFGCSISCNLFEKFATFLQWLVEQRSRLHSVDHYLDDFIFIGAKSTGHCSILMEAFSKVCNEFLLQKKNNWTCYNHPFSGFVIDTVRMMVIIPQEKLEKLQSELSSLLHRKKIITLRELEFITGLMSFCSRAIPSSRAFIHTFNGQCFFPERVWLSNDILQLFTDSSGNRNLGCGAFFNGIVGDPVNVWIVGSSIVKHAFVAARDRPGWVNLGLGRLNASFW